MGMTDTPGTSSGGTGLMGRLLWGPGKHFGIRAGGLLGLLILVQGIFLLAVGEMLVGILLAVLGGAAAALVLAVEMNFLTHVVASRRTAAGSNVGLQVLLASALLVEINAFSFFHYHRFDWTRNREFTLSPKIQEQLARLRGETNIVIYLSHNFGQLADKRDEYDFAAERVVIDKVQDMAEQFREFGPQFKVEILDRKDKNYGERFDALEKESPDLAKAVRAANEDSVFVAAQNRVQRLGFEEIFQVDKMASKKANNNKGNLVLNFQGIEPFARRILNTDDRKPRVALAVIHPLLGSESDVDELSMAGARKTLQAHGFEVQDILLKSGWEEGMPQPAVLSPDENKYDELDGEIAYWDQVIAEAKDNRKELERQLKLFQEAPLKDLNKEFGEAFGQRFGVRTIDDRVRQWYLSRLRPSLDLEKLQLEQAEKAKGKARQEQRSLDVSDLAEQRRISDLRAKLARKLADCDLLILPRHTLLDVSNRQGRVGILNQLYQLDRAQVGAIQDFLRRGKPVMFLFGPTNDPSGIPPDLMHGRSDGLERMLGELGLRFGGDVVLFNSDFKSFGERRGSLIIFGAKSDPPPVEFQWESGNEPFSSQPRGKGKERANPIAESMLLTLGGLGSEQPSDIKLKHPRPVEYAGRLPYSPTFMMSAPASWRVSNPFPSGKSIPSRDPKKEGQVSLGVAVEATLPKTWKPEQDKVRVVAVGHGGLFIGNKLSPVRQKLLLDTCNWLLGRDDLLNRKQHEAWQYPRVEMSDGARRLWALNACLWIPLAFACVGVVVLMKRAQR